MSADETIANNSVIDRITELIKKLQATIENSLNNAQDKIKETVGKLYEFAQGILDAAKGKIHEAVQNALEQLGKINEDAAALGVDVAACIKGQDEKLSEINDRSLRELGDCIDKNIRRAGDIADETLNSLTNMLGFVDDDLEYFRDCAGSIKCYLGLGLEIGLQTIRIPRDILLILDHTILTIHSINKDILLCNADAVLQVATSINGVLDETRTCVQESIDNSTNTRY